MASRSSPVKCIQRVAAQQKRMNCATSYSMPNVGKSSPVNFLHAENACICMSFEPTTRLQFGGAPCRVSLLYQTPQRVDGSVMKTVSWPYTGCAHSQHQRWSWIFLPASVHVLVCCQTAPALPMDYSAQISANFRPAATRSKMMTLSLGLKTQTVLVSRCLMAKFESCYLALFADSMVASMPDSLMH